MTGMLYGRYIAEKFFNVTDVYIFMLLYLQNTYRDKAAEKECDIAIQITMSSTLQFKDSRKQKRAKK